MAREEMISPELQRQAIQEWARRTGHRIIDWVEDLDKTGRNFKRKIMRVIERVEHGEAKAIAVWKYSRFGRNRTGIELNLARIEQAGGQLLSATEDVDATTATGWFQRDVIFSVATFESKRAGEQWAETHQWRRDHGLPAMGKPRFGYTWYPRKTYSSDGTISLQEERYEPDPRLTEVVTALYKRYTAGEASFRSLALWLNEEGHRTVRGDQWTGKAIRRYLDSGFAAGYLRFHLKTCPKGSFPHDCDQYELTRHPTNHHPAIISDETWRQYCERREFTRTAAPRARRAAYPLTGLVRCGLCGAAAVRKVDGRRTAVYTCLRRNERGPLGCAGASLVDHVIEGEVRRFLADLAKDIDAASERAAEGGPVKLGGHPDERRRVELERSVAKLERSIARHMRAYAMSEEDDADGSMEKQYLELLKELRAEKASLSAELAKLRSRLDNGGEEAKRMAVLPVALGLLEEWETLAPEVLNALLRRVVGRVELLGSRQARVVPAWEV